MSAAPETLFAFVPAGHALSGFLAERRDVIGSVLATLGPDWSCDSADLKLGEPPRWSPGRLACHLTNGTNQALHIWSRKRGGHDGVLHRFPDDPYLPGLAAWSAAPRDAQGRPLAGLRLLRHVPTRRATLSATAAGGSGPERQVIKFKRPSKADHAAEMLERVAAAVAAQGEAVRVAAPLGRLPYHAGFCQSFIEGAPLDGLVDEANLVGLMGRAGEVHARLHALAVPGVAGWSLDAYTGAIAHDVAFLRHLDMPLADEMDAAWRRLEPRLAQARCARPVFCHGDFVPGQLLVDGDHVAVTDFDMARHGIDLQEVGKWLASLRYHLPAVSRAASRDFDRGEHLLRRAGDAYLAGYETAAGHRLDRDAVAAFTAAADIHYLGIRAKKDELPAWTARIIRDRIAAWAA